MKNHTTWTVWIIVVLLIIVCVLVHISKGQEEAQMEKLSRLHAAELSTCWSAVEETGGTCRIEYLRDRTGTIYSAKVVRETE